MDKMIRIKNAFTIIELLVVVVVIGILATITISSYSNITSRANVAALQADLVNNKKILGLYYTTYGFYPTAISNTNYCATAPTADNNYCLKISPNNSLNSYQSLSSTSFILKINNGPTIYQITESTSAVVAAPSTFAVGWGGSASDGANGLTATSDGGYAVTGSTSSYGAGGGDFFLAKYSSTGALQWNRTWGGNGSYPSDTSFAVVQTSDGGYVVGGLTYTLSVGWDDVAIIKYDANGNFLWNRTWGGPSYDEAWSMIATADGGFAWAGHTYGYGAGGDDWLIGKFNSTGTIQWVRTWGGSGGDWAFTIAQTTDNGLVVDGNTPSFGAGGGDAAIVKFDANGNFLWNKTWGGAAADSVRGIAATSDGGSVEVGQTSSYGAGAGDALIIKYDSAGNMQWNKTWGGTAADNYNAVIQTSDGGYLAVGATSSFGAGGSDALAVKYDSSGNVLWSKTWGNTGNDYANAVVIASDGLYAIAGSTSSYGAGSDDSLLFKLDGSGNLNGCSSPVCQTVSGTITTPAVSLGVPAATVTSPSATNGTPGATMTNPAAVTTIIF